MADLDLGASLSVGEQSVQLLAGIKASMDGMTARLDKVLAAQEDYQRHGPVRISLRRVGTANSSGSAFALDLGGPTYGRLWEVRRLVVGGATWGTTAAGTAQVVVLPTSPETTTDPAMTDVVDEAASLPSRAFYSSGQLVVRSPQRLWVVILSPTASQSYAAGGEGFDVPDRPTRLAAQL